MENILKELVGLQISADAIVLNLKWAIAIPIILFEVWVLKRALQSFIPRRKKK